MRIAPWTVVVALLLAGLGTGWWQGSRVASGDRVPAVTGLPDDGLVPVGRYLQSHRSVVAFVTRGLSEWSSALKEMGIHPASLQTGPEPVYQGDFGTPPPGEAGLHPTPASARVTVLNATVARVMRVDDANVRIELQPAPGRYHLTGMELTSFRRNGRVKVRFVTTGGQTIGAEVIGIEKMG